MGMPFVIIAGTIGNVLAAIIMLRPRFRKLSASVYLLFLAFADTGCLLLNHKVQYWMMKGTGVSLFSVPWLCRIYLWLTLSVPFVSSWLVVLVSLERVFIVCRPLHAKVWCTRKTAWRASLGLVLVMLLGNTYVFALGKPGVCVVKPNAVYVITVTAIVMFSCLPFVIILISNAIIVYQLVRQKRYISKRLSTTVSPQGDTQRLTTMLLANSCVFLILTLPYNTMLSYKQLGGRPVLWVVAIAEYLLCLNHACNFLLYTITGSLYRQELTDMCCGYRLRRNRSRYYSVGQRSYGVTGSVRNNNSVEITAM